MPDEILRLRQTWPDVPHIFHVLNEAGDSIARVSHDGHVPPGVPRWSWCLQAFGYRARGDFADRCDTREEALAAIKRLWPAYHAELEYDGWLERVRRERLSVPTMMFIYRDQYETAPADIEALTGCLEGTVEEARLSLLVDALAHQEKHGYALRIRLPPDIAALDRLNCWSGFDQPISGFGGSEEGDPGLSGR